MPAARLISSTDDANRSDHFASTRPKFLLGDPSRALVRRSSHRPVGPQNRVQSRRVSEIPVYLVCTWHLLGAEASTQKYPLSWVFFGGDEGNRTPDIYLAKVALCQLSYVPALRYGGRQVIGSGCASYS